MSIIIPVFNNKHLLLDALQSCADQIYKNVEILVIDDGSTDGLSQAYIENNGFSVKYYLTQNRGAGLARNYGLSRASGEYVFFLDSDDTNPKRAIADLVSGISDLDFVIGKSKRCFIDRFGDFNRSEIWKPANFAPGSDLKRCITDTLSTNKLYRLGFLRSNEIFFEATAHEDILFICKLFEATERYAVIDSFVHHWNVREGVRTLSSELTLETLRSRMEVVDSAINQLTDEKLRRIFIRNVINHDLKRYVNCSKNYKKSELDELYFRYKKFVEKYWDYLDADAMPASRKILLSIESIDLTQREFLAVSNRRDSFLRRILRSLAEYLKNEP
ncbi:MAG: glycosyltransferase family 2 protein [Halioglobus sp.]